MAGPVSFFQINLNESVIDGAKLVHKVVEEHTCAQLRRWLKCHGRKVTGSKKELVARVKNAIENEVSVDPSVDKGKWFDEEEKKQRSILNNNIPKFADNWKIFPSTTIPSNFNDSSIYDYIISTCIVSGVNSSDDSDVCPEPSKEDYSTSKPLKRGRVYVDSDHVYEVFDGSSPEQYYCVKCKVQASFKAGTFYNVKLMINPINGKVIVGECNCKASGLGRCSHVVALLYTLLDFQKEHDKENACTTQLCVWNRGRKRKQPHTADEKQYSNKRSSREKKLYDPADTLKCQMNMQKVSELLADLQKSSTLSNKEPCMWELLLVPRYEEYELSLSRKSILRTLVFRLTMNLTKELVGPFDVTCGIQSDSEEWWQLRRLLVTASNIKYFSSDKSKEQIFAVVESQLWRDNRISTEAIKYGKTNEKNAKEHYKAFGIFDVSDTGLWVNSKFPGLGASPDALVTDLKNNSQGLLEIKCPKILENFLPTDLHKLTPSQKSSFCCTLIERYKMTLKRTHKYYYQVQMQMAITERLWCDFVIWTPQGFHLERIFYNKDFIMPVLNRAIAFHQNILCPEYFEMRIPRKLPPFDLSKQ